MVVAFQYEGANISFIVALNFFQINEVGMMTADKAKWFRYVLVVSKAVVADMQTV